MRSCFELPGLSAGRTARSGVDGHAADGAHGAGCAGRYHPRHHQCRGSGRGVQEGGGHGPNRVLQVRRAL